MRTLGVSRTFPIHDITYMSHSCSPPFYRLKKLRFKVLKSLLQGHSLGEWGTGWSPNPPSHIHTPDTHSHSCGSPSSEEFPAEFPTPHHSVPGMVQPLLLRRCSLSDAPLCPVARFSLAPVGLSLVPWQASHWLCRVARALCSSGPGVWMKECCEGWRAQRALKAVMSSGPSCLIHTRSLWCASQSAWKSARP